MGSEVPPFSLPRMEHFRSGSDPIKIIDQGLLLLRPLIASMPCDRKTLLLVEHGNLAVHAVLADQTML